MVPGFASVLCYDSWSCSSAETGCVSNDLEGPKRWGVGTCIVLIESGGEVRVLREITDQKWTDSHISALWHIFVKFAISKHG